jgi:23S rRNA pseudouridine1911/1915/1917 synthase
MEFTLSDRTIYINTDSLYEKDLDAFFERYVPSSKVRHLLIQDKAVRLDGKPLRRGDALNGDILGIDIYPLDNASERSEGAKIIYEDPFVVAVYKSAGILVHTDGSDEETLSDHIMSFFGGTHIVPYPLHRLDRDTRGIVLFSKTPVFQPLFDSMIAGKEIRRRYHAYVSGYFEPGKTLRVEKPIGRDRHRSGRYIVSASGKEAATVFTGLQYDKERDMSLIDCALETGRTHQIRVHLMSLGYGIVNDPIYGVSGPSFSGMGLIAYSLEYRDPFTGKDICITLGEDEGLF